MGKIIYQPKKEASKQEMNKKETSKKEPSIILNTVKKAEESKKSSNAIDFTEQRYNALIESIDSVRPVGDTDCEYVVYLEDYVYTYIYQYAATDLEREHSAVVLGEFYPDTKEVIVCGILPIAKDKLKSEDEWVNQEAVQQAMEERDKYFKGASILGWMHMQPGYGNMLTMKEVKAHRDLFDREGTLLLLLDPINRIENFYIYEDDNLKEQSGYYIYYDKNACMQQYMLQHPFIVQEKEQVDDTVVNQFREIGRKRKKEYEQRKKLNFTVAASALALLAMSAVVLKMNDQRKLINDFKKTATNEQVAPSGNNKVADENIKFTIEPSGEMANKDTENNTNNTNPIKEKEDAQTQEQVVDVNSNELTVVDHTAENSKASQVEKENAKAEEMATGGKTEKEEAKIEKEEVKTEKEEVKAKKDKEEVKKDTAKEKNEKTTVTQAKETSEDYVEYVVQEGDTLRKISYDHYQTEGRTKDIIKLNDIDNGDQIYVGQKIKIPAE